MNRFLRGMVAAFAVVISYGCAGAHETLDMDPANMDLIGKCTFASGSSQNIEPGEAFVYVFRDAGDDRYGVVSRIAEIQEPLLEQKALQKTEPLVAARMVGGVRLEWGNLDHSPEGQARNFVGMGPPTGELTTSVGTTELTDQAYPLCVFWGP